MLNEEAPQVVLTVAFVKRLAIKWTAREGTRANTAPPAALLAPEAHDADDVVDSHSIKEQLLTRKTDEKQIALAALEDFDNTNNEAPYITETAPP